MASGWNLYTEPADLYGNDKTVLCVLRGSNSVYVYDYGIRDLGEWKRQFTPTSRVAITLFYSTNTAILWFDSTKRIEYTGNYTVDVYYK